MRVMAEGDPKEGDPKEPGGAPLEVGRGPPRPRRSPARTLVRNRRFAALQELLRGGEYFSEQEMRAREPLLYQHYIGQYQEGDPPPPRGTPPSGPWGAPPSLSALLLRSMEEAAVQQRLSLQRLQEGAEDGAAPPSPPPVPGAWERALLRAEFLSRMEQRFLEGRDRDFDYSQVDGNADLDVGVMAERDAEERYFDAEEPSAAPPLQ